MTVNKAQLGQRSARNPGRQLLDAVARAVPGLAARGHTNVERAARASTQVRFAERARDDAAVEYFMSGPTLL